MKLEKLNYGKNKNHKILLYGLISVVVLLLAITLITSRANYKISSSVKLAKGKINYKAPDLNVIAIYVNNGDGNYIELATDEVIPKNSYAINEQKSYCYKTTSSEHDEKVKLYTNDYGEHVISDLSKNDKCYLYFDRAMICKNSDACKSIKNNISSVLERTSDNKDFNVPFGDTTSKTIYLAEDDYGISYYYAGGTTDNWVKFGKESGTGVDIWWRIIRINGNGSIRLIYSGTIAPTSSQASVMLGTQTQIGISKFNIKGDDNMYEGFYYTSNQVHGYGTPSNVYSNTEGDINGTSLKGFYEKNIKGQTYEKWIDENVGFCNDRQPSSSQTEVNNIGGTGKTTTFYAGYIRLSPGGVAPTISTATVRPTLKCGYQGTSENSYKDSDLFTAKSTTDIGSTKGNKLLDYPVGLITADETSYAGLVSNGSIDMTTNYLYTGQQYHTITPSYNHVSDSSHHFGVREPGSVRSGYTVNVYGVRPVINLKADTKFIGTGTYNNPYRLAD